MRLQQEEREPKARAEGNEYIASKYPVVVAAKGELETKGITATIPQIFLAMILLGYSVSPIRKDFPTLVQWCRWLTGEKKVPASSDTYLKLRPDDITSKVLDGIQEYLPRAEEILKGFNWEKQN